MSFSGTRRRSAGLQSSMVVLLIMFLVLEIWDLNSCCKADAIRTPPPPPPPPPQQPPSPPYVKDSDELKRSELYKRFFNGRFNSTNLSKANNFQESKRRVPSCPDPLHN